MSSITLNALSKQYTKEKHTLDHISLEIKDKEFLVLLGPSGCGKSTLLRMIAGIEEITHGEVYIGDVCVNDVEPKDRGVAMVFQNYALYPHMTVFENMAYGLKIKKVKKAERERRIKAAADILQINSLLKRLPSQLSGGQKQRVAIGRAIVKEPKVFLMDEPLSNLDAKLRNEMRIEIKKLHERLNSTFIYVTHDQVEAVTLGDRIAIMAEGKFRQIGTPMEIIDCPVDMFVANFISSPPINYLDAVLMNRNGQTYVDIDGVLLETNLPIEVMKDSPKVVAGIRPEHCFITEDTNNALEMEVLFTEIIGTDVLLHLKYKTFNFIVKKSFTETYAKGQKLHVGMHANHVNVFDKQTEKNLRSRQ
ncbi:sn-glycerol-3-phosphate ABC transporter ATP-binding protein UgpC [Brevibacillus choshinensis]|uniref:ABC transporter ATP-binding protein n=2 Tax=Brevibacillus choshinensis TaxID=54911 RepID=UPI002E1C78AE|nr:sn-glycerol-3-phosphate ABC transporter ATP-binding protein UgpC [Brevibacillus choshinensis]MED4584989.1 sn-glycerol-3-phosphate ABC transporter ATP-binding protein UgpC [Brevibacillus choshinensis]MED4753654.1 sn-glycerol-3-phosphate ABC transporter ATP-binding protein UgpC [Brevibacillus choshinensis]MED4781915.1 sn-glycerol-3-phosphate ABC transporter ATP-binding protein UgpC [Brevibacillus choshinensis]